MARDSSRAALMAAALLPLAAAGAAPQAGTGGPVLVGGERLNGPLAGNTTGAAISRDGRTLITARGPADWSSLRLELSRMGVDGWQAPEPLPWSGDDGRDTDPRLTPDGRTLLFASDRASPGRSRDPKAYDYRIWSVARHGDGWGEPRPLGPPIVDFGKEFEPSMTSSGDLYFTRAEDGGKAMREYVAHRRGASFSTPEPVRVPGVETVFDASVSADGRVMAFVSETRPGSHEGAIFVTRRAGGSWSPARMLPSHVPGRTQVSTALSPDARTVYFASSDPNPDGSRSMHLYSVPVTPDRSQGSARLSRNR